MTIWICGRTENSNWEILGAFSTEELAIDRCTMDSDFVAPLDIDESLSDEIIEWPRLYYPLESEEKT